MSIVLAGAVFAAPASAIPPRGEKGDLSIVLLSGRTDTVTGGDVLIRVVGRIAKQATITLNGAEVASVRKRSSGHVEGIVSGLQFGANTIAAETKHARDEITVDN
ncbi:MAG TPA: DUF6351 family protein, partial [Microbacterium sp.]|uniref:DUF6351 family protein n=1 Tax=Microbacterium sp. TaxID=51671 RepID=UPI002C6315F6